LSYVFYLLVTLSWNPLDSEREKSRVIKVAANLDCSELEIKESHVLEYKPVILQEFDEIIKEPCGRCSFHFAANSEIIANES
jgi:hypothetical protein